jgi:flagellar basal-body rod modification protein FlgD
MTVSTIETMNLASSEMKTTGKKELDKSDFMTLFITQLQYQDPMKPMEGEAMAAQLAQFSSMEATMKMSESLDELLAYQTSQNNLQLISLLDTTVMSHGNQIAVNGGNTSRTEFVITEDIKDCVVEIFDAADRKVTKIDMPEADGAGVYELAWDGTNPNGNQVEDGSYYYIVKGKNINGTIVDVDYRSTGTVTGVDFDNGLATLTIDGQMQITVGDVLRVLDKNEAMVQPGSLNNEEAGDDSQENEEEID